MSTLDGENMTKGNHDRSRSLSIFLLSFIYWFSLVFFCLCGSIPTQAHAMLTTKRSRTRRRKGRRKHQHSWAGAHTNTHIWPAWWYRCGKNRTRERSCRTKNSTRKKVATVCQWFCRRTIVCVYAWVNLRSNVSVLSSVIVCDHECTHLHTLSRTHTCRAAAVAEW